MRKAIVHTAVRAGLATAAVAALATLTAGCGPFDNQSSPPPTTTSRDLDKIAVFDPCTQIPDQALISQGLNPASKQVVTDPAVGPTSWRVCNWEPADRGYAVGIFSTSHTLGEAQKNDNFTGFSDLTVNGRQGLIFHEKPGSIDTCHVAFAAGQGMFDITAEWQAGDNNHNGDLCVLARRHAFAFEPILPK